MDTKVFDLRGKEPDEADEIREAWESEEISEAAEILKAGGIVAFPTETVYGLGADALNAEAVAKIYKAKGRPSDNPIIVHVASMDDLYLLTDDLHGPSRNERIGKTDKVEEERLLKEVRLLAEAFWPGPLTMILQKKPEVPDVTTGGLDTVAIRMPDSKIALELIRKTGRPLAAPSANISGKPSPTTGEHVLKDLLGKVEGIILGEDCKVGIESTVLDMTGSSPIILRPGIITKEALSRVLGRTVLMGSDPDSEVKSPGTRYAHYSPKAEMLLLKGDRALVAKEIERIKKEKSNLKLGIFDGGDKTPEEAAKIFFKELRKMDEEAVDLIIAIAPGEDDSVGCALMNRMLKAAGNNCRLIK